MLAGAAERPRTVGRSFKAGRRSGVTSGNNRAEPITDFGWQISLGSATLLFGVDAGNQRPSPLIGRSAATWATVGFSLAFPV